MKKILNIFIILILFLSFNVFALDNVVVNDNGDYLTDDAGNIYPSFEKKVNGRNVYALNPEANLNLDLSSYYEISFSESPFAETVQDFGGFFKIINESSNYLHHTSFVEELIWEELYGKEYNIVSDNSETYNSKREKFRNTYFALKEGLDIFETTKYININEENIYENEYLKYYDVVSSIDEVSLNKYDNYISMSVNTPGVYEIKLKRGFNYVRGTHLYTDGTNYILSAGIWLDKTYSFKLAAGVKYFEISANNTNNNPIENRCYNFYDQNNSNNLLDTKCTDSNGIASLYVNENIENLIVESQNSDDYNNFKASVELMNNETKVKEYVTEKENSQSSFHLITIYVWDENNNRVENRCYDFYINNDFENVFLDMCTDFSGIVSLIFNEDVTSLAIKSKNTPSMYEESNFFINLTLNTLNTLEERLLLKEEKPEDDKKEIIIDEDNEEKIDENKEEIIIDEDNEEKIDETKEDVIIDEDNEEKIDESKEEIIIDEGNEEKTDESKEENDEDKKEIKEITVYDNKNTLIKKTKNIKEESKVIKENTISNDNNKNNDMVLENNIVTEDENIIIETNDVTKEDSDEEVNNIVNQEEKSENGALNNKNSNYKRYAIIYLTVMIIIIILLLILLFLR